MWTEVDASRPSAAHCRHDTVGELLLWLRESGSRRHRLIRQTPTPRAEARGVFASLGRNDGAHNRKVNPMDASVSDAGEVDVDPALAEIVRLRDQIDEVDTELVGIVQRRIALSKQIQAVRMAHGGRRREHSRELKIVNTYVEGLGRGGSQLALTLLELCRGRA